MAPEWKRRNAPSDAARQEGGVRAPRPGASPSITKGLKLPSPFLIEVAVEAANIDAFGHVNNTVYLTWFEMCAWAHSAAVGLPVEACVALRRGMAVRRSEIDYRRPAMAGDTLTVANWVVRVDRLTARREFQLVRTATGELLAEAGVDYVCINLDTGAPARMPPPFVERYVVEPEVAAALDRSTQPGA